MPPLGMPKVRSKTYIQEWRTYRDLSQETLAEKANMSPGNVSLIENGKQDYTQTTLEAFARALRCKPFDLISRPPSDADSTLALYSEASPEQRRQIDEITKAVLKPLKG